nr:integrase, catalytic region, zinc finger, CCHC-type, peptidase aspartic, catalytic [Tanacetum cinerariifolium]
MIRRMHPNRGRGEIAELDADENVTLEEVDAEVTMDANVQGRLEESKAKVYHLDLEHAEKVLSMHETDEAEPVEVEEVIEVVTAAKLMTEVVTTAAPTITAAPVPKASAPRRRRDPISIHNFIIMSNTNNNMQTQTSNTLHNAIIEAGSKDRPPLLAPDKEVPIYEGSPVTRTESHMETYKTVSKFTSQDGESLESYYSRFYKMTNELIRNECDVTNHQVNVQFLLQLQPEWQRFMTLVKQSQELKTVSYHKLYDILKQHQNEVNEIRAERIAHTANPLALVAQQQPVYHPQTHPTHYTQNSSTRSQQADTRNRGKVIVNSPEPIYDQESSIVAEDDEMSKDKEIDKFMALISLSSTGYEHKRIGNVAGARETVGSTVVQKSRIQYYNCKEFRHIARECQKPKRAKDAAYYREKMLLSHYMYMAQLQEVSPNAADSEPIFDADPLQKVSNDDHYNVFAIESAHPEQSKSVHDTYPIEQDAHNVIINSLDMSYDREEIDQNDDNNDLDNERELLASLIEKLKCEIDESKNHNKFLETSNKVLIEKLKELARRNSVEYTSKVETDSAKARGDLISYKMESQKSFNKYTQTINDLNQTIFEMKEKLCAHQETISILSQQKEAQIKLYKTREDKELDKVIALKTKVKGTTLEHDSLCPGIKCQEFVTQTDRTVTTSNELDFLFNSMFDELLNESSKVVSKSSAVSTADAPNQRQQESTTPLNNQTTPNPTCQVPTQAPTITSTENMNQAEMVEEYAHHDMCVLNSVAKPLKKTIALESNQKPRNITRKLYERVSKACSWWYLKFTPSGYKWKPKSGKENVNPNVKIVLFIVDFGCSLHMTRNLKLLINFVEKFLGTVKFGNEKNAPILGYGDLVQGAVTIKRVYYVEGLNQNLFSVGQFCDADLEVAFRKSTCYIHDLKGNDLLTGSRGTDLYSITLQDTNSPNPICLMAKATSSQAWLWHRRLSHLNFDTINLLSKNDIVVGLQKLKFVKDHLCSLVSWGKPSESLFTLKLPQVQRDDYNFYTWTYVVP